jgi:hypothetical protein
LAPAAAAQERYEDGAFDVDGGGVLVDWSIYGSFNDPPDAPGGGYDAAAPRSGGNHGAFLRPVLTSVTVPMGGMWAVWGILINDQAVYNPATMGPIERIDFDFDSRLPPGERGSRAVSLAVQQDGFLWGAIARRELITEASWTPWSISDLQAADLVPHIWMEDGQPAMPDFSENGSPISFGIVQGQSCPATSDCSAPPTPIEVDIDNWAVTVNDTALRIELSVAQVPEPGELPELPLELVVSATVRNAGSVDVSDIETRFLLPKEALAGFSIPESECVPDSASLSEAVIADCSVEDPVGPDTEDTVRVPTGLLSDSPPRAVISAGYAGVVADESEFTYQVEITSFSERDPEPGDVLMDEVVVAICNPTGSAPVLVEDISDCADLPTGGTGGDGGSGGTTGTGGSTGGNTGGGCGCYTTAPGATDPWVPFLYLAAFAIWRRCRRRPPARN